MSCWIPYVHSSHRAIKSCRAGYHIHTSFLLPLLFFDDFLLLFGLLFCLSQVFLFCWVGGGFCLSVCLLESGVLLFIVFEKGGPYEVGWGGHQVLLHAGMHVSIHVYATVFMQFRMQFTGNHLLPCSVYTNNLSVMYFGCFKVNYNE